MFQKWNIQQTFFDSFFSLSTRSTVPKTVEVKDLASNDLIVFKREPDIFPIILANCNYTYVQDETTKLEYDFENIQTVLLDRFLFGKPVIDTKMGVGKKIVEAVFFSSHELKAQVSFSDHLSSVVCMSVCPSFCKLFTFSSSSPEPLGKFQPNVAQSSLEWRGFKFDQKKGPTMTKLKNPLPHNHWANFKQYWQKAFLGEGDSSFFSNEGPCPFPQGDNYEITKIHRRNLKIFFFRTTRPISTKVGTKHPWVKGI